MTAELRLDGLASMLTGLGKVGVDPGATFVPSTYLPNKDELAALLRSSGWARRIVSLLPEHALRQGFEVYLVDSADDVDLLERVKERAIRLNLVTKIGQAMRQARLFGGAGVVLGVNDGQIPAAPVDEAHVVDVSWGLVVNRHELFVDSLQGDWNSPRFGEHELYRVNPHGAMSSNQLVHASRVLRFDGAEVPRELAAQNGYWSDSLLTSLWADIGRVEAVEAAIALITQRLNMLVWKMKGLRAVSESEDGLAVIQRRLVANQLALGIMNATLLDADGESAEVMVQTLSGLAENYDRLVQSLSAASGIPLTLLIGQAPGGLSTDDAGGRTYWYDQVRATHTHELVPVVLQAVTLLARAEGYQGKVQVEFCDLTNPTDAERTATRKTQAEIDYIYLNAGVITAGEVRSSRFNGEYSHDTKIESAIGNGDE